MKTTKLFTLTVILLMGMTFIYGASFSADEIVQKMDDHRLISDHFEMTIRVESFNNNHFESATVMKGHVDNGKMTMLTFLEPLKMKDRKIVIKGNDTWLIIPKVKNPIRITSSQRLMAGLSYGDIAGVSFTRGYTAKLSTEEVISGLNSDGGKSDPKPCFVLDLMAKESGTKYNKITMWVDNQYFYPVKADFFALSGKKMTTAYFTAPKEWNGKTMITKIFLFDQINTKKYFSMEYSDIEASHLSDNTEDSIQ